VLFGIFLFVLAIASSTMNGHLSDSLAGTRDLVVKSFEWFGNLTIFCGRVVRAVFLPPHEGREFVHQFDELGSKSLPLVALAGAATGVVLTLSTRDSLIRFGVKSLLPAVVVLSIIRRAVRSSHWRFVYSAFACFRTGMSRAALSKNASLRTGCGCQLS